MTQQTSLDFSTPSMIFVCVKWVATRLEVDPVDGTVTHQPQDARFSTADLAAVETALRLADGPLDDGADGAAIGSRPELVVVCVGPAAADDPLRDLIATGVDRVIRIDSGAGPDPSDQPDSADVATAIAETITAATTAATYLDSPDPDVDVMADVLVVCGDTSADRGSGSVPAFLADRLRCSQALGLVEVSSSAQYVSPGSTSPGSRPESSPVDPGSPFGVLRCVRRLDGGRRELLAVTTPAVISVEGSVARLRRAPLASMVRSRDATIEVHRTDLPTATDRSILRPYRPRTRVVAPPTGEHALERIEQLTGARTDRTPPRSITVEPREAARIIVDQIREWGYEWRTD